MQMHNHLPLDEHLTCFQLFALANNAAEKNFIQASWGTLLSISIGQKLLD